MPLPNRPAAQQRRYSEQERAQAVRLVRQARAEGRGQGAVARVAHQLGYGVESARSWVKQADIDAGRRAGHHDRRRRAAQGARGRGERAAPGQ